MRAKLWIAVGCALVLAAGVLTIPSPAPSAVAVPQERATPLLEQEVQRREQLRIFGELQQLGPRLARHSVTIPAVVGTPSLPSDVAPPSPRIDPAGHGLIVSADGEVLTSAGALRGRESLQVELLDGSRAEARVIAFDPDTDLVLLRSASVPRTDAAPWAAEPPAPGMLTVAVAHASGHVAVAPVFVTAAPDADRRIRTTTAELAPGTPLFTVAGEVFAVAVGGSVPSAVLVAPAVARLRDRIAAGQARRGALGLTFQPIEGALAEVHTMPGVLVADVAQHGPADDAGVLPGDLITAIGDRPVTSIDEIQPVIAQLELEAPVVVHVLRGGQPIEIDVVATSALGLRVRQVPRTPVEDAPQALTLFDAEQQAAADLRPRSRVLAINGQPVRTVDEARGRLRRARPPVLLYIEDERGRFFRVLEPVP
ncbi:MAG TPA: PDZ domain-containing protein [Vicinamibacterales bacterium]|nr:PDZ domain-containing protein [Vicinamibacterales bacterium]